MQIIASSINPSAPREGFIPIHDAEIYVREVGQRQPLLILHGGPDFDHTYFLPEMDQLSDAFRLVYYDQRGRGRSAEHVQPEDVTIQSEVEDLEQVRRYFQWKTVPLLGHSWGGLLALEYALQYPERVSHLILLNTAPVSHPDYLQLREDRRKQAAEDLEKLHALRQTTAYQEGDPDTVAAYYRFHFRAALRRPEHLEQVITRLRASFTREGILKARAVEKQLLQETWFSRDYDLLPRLGGLHVPTLVLHGDQDFIPLACAAHIVQAISGARFTLLRDCGHFSYLECPEKVRKEILAFFQDH